MDVGSGLASFGANMADAMQEYHKRHSAYDQQMKMAEALANIGYTPDGRITNIAQAGEGGQKAKPIIDPKFMEQFRTKNQSEWDKNTGALQMMNRLVLNLVQHAAGQAISDAGLSGQRTKQIMQQSEQSFPLEQEARAASTAHIKKLTDDEGKIDVPGFGKMTPSQYSVHQARMERMKVLDKKLDPIKTFETQLQNTYGLGIKDIVDASQPQQFVGGDGKTYKGTPFHDIGGNQVPGDKAFKDAKTASSTFVFAGPNKVPIPLLSKQGLGWQQIVPKAKSFATQMDEIGNQQSTLQQQNALHQAQQVIAVVGSKDPNSLTPQDQAALAKAKQILGQ